MRRLTDDQRALRALLLRVRYPHCTTIRGLRQVNLAALDGRWLAEALHAAEPGPVRVTFRGIDGARALASVHRTPLATDAMRKAGITETSTPAEVVAITLRRLAGAVAWLHDRGFGVSGYREASTVVFTCSRQLPLGAGQPLEEAA
jgi:hypothetical protein